MSPLMREFSARWVRAARAEGLGFDVEPDGVVGFDSRDGTFRVYAQRMQIGLVVELGGLYLRPEDGWEPALAARNRESVAGLWVYSGERDGSAWAQLDAVLDPREVRPGELRRQLQALVDEARQLQRETKGV